MFDFGILVFTTFKLQQRKNPGKKIVPQTHKKTKTLSKSRNPQNQKTRKEIKIVFFLLETPGRLLILNSEFLVLNSEFPNYMLF